MGKITCMTNVSTALLTLPKISSFSNKDISAEKKPDDIDIDIKLLLRHHMLEYRFSLAMNNHLTLLDCYDYIKSRLWAGKPFHRRIPLKKNDFKTSKDESGFLSGILF